MHSSIDSRTSIPGRSSSTLSSNHYDSSPHSGFFFDALYTPPWSDTSTQPARTRQRLAQCQILTPQSCSAKVSFSGQNHQATVAKLFTENLLLLHVGELGDLDIVDMHLVTWHDSTSTSVAIVTRSSGGIMYPDVEAYVRVLATGSSTGTSGNGRIATNIGNALTDMLAQLSQRLALFAPSLVDKAVKYECHIYDPRRTRESAPEVWILIPSSRSYS